MLKFQKYRLTLADNVVSKVLWQWYLFIIIAWVTAFTKQRTWVSFNSTYLPILSVSLFIFDAWSPTYNTPLPHPILLNSLNSLGFPWFLLHKCVHSHMSPTGKGPINPLPPALEVSNLLGLCCPLGGLFITSLSAPAYVLVLESHVHREAAKL